MKNDFEWKVFRVPGHRLEGMLNELTQKQYEVVTFEYTDRTWTIITRLSAHTHPKGKVIGFTAVKE